MAAYPALTCAGSPARVARCERARRQGHCEGRQVRQRDLHKEVTTHRLVEQVVTVVDQDERGPDNCRDHGGANDRAVFHAVVRSTVRANGNLRWSRPEHATLDGERSIQEDQVMTSSRRWVAGSDEHPSGCCWPLGKRTRISARSRIARRADRNRACRRGSRTRAAASPNRSSLNPRPEGPRDPERALELYVAEIGVPPGVFECAPQVFACAEILRVW